MRNGYIVHFRFIIRMKLALIMTTCAIMNVSANVFSQQKVSLDVQKTKLSRVLKMIEAQSDYYFVYNSTNENLNKEVSVNVTNSKVLDVLSKLFNKSGLVYSVSKEGLVVISQQQQVAVAGQVTDDKGNPLAGASVRVKGTAVGRATDINGRFSIEASTGNILIVSFAGYTSQEVAVTKESDMKIVLLEDNRMLNEVVVTALGQKKEKRSLGYSVTQVAGESLTTARENNVMNTLAGKVAGLDISSTAGGAGAATNVTIRGVSSLNQTNQPLYVINGIPMESKPVGLNNGNSKGNSGSQWDNAPDLGDAISNINPDDIESISVLKGAAASALYGSRAKAGVILITTKSGKGNSIDFSSNYVAERIIDQTHWQTEYGHGGGGIKPANIDNALSTGASSWGAKLDGSPVLQFDGKERPYSLQKGNLGRFYRTGNTWTNTIALNKSFEGGSIRLSGTDVKNKSVVPNSGLDRQSFNLAGLFEPLKGLTVDGRINLIYEQVKNRPMLSDGAGNANFNVMFLPTSINVNDLKPWKDENGKEIGYSGNVYATNPWFAAYEFQNNTDRRRTISSLTAKYTLDNGLFFQGRAGRDSYADRYKNVVASGTAYYTRGKISEQNTNFDDINADILIGQQFTFGDISITPNIGASYRNTKTKQITNNGVDLAVFGNYNITNAKNQSLEYNESEQETQSAYGTLEFAYKDVLYLTGSLRSDWFSTLAASGYDNKLNSVYPSISGSFVYSEYLKAPWLNFGKLRAGYATVGQATDPYQTLLGYRLRSESLNETPLGIIDNTRIPNPELIASSASEFEIGTELRLFNDRINVDLTWYNKKSKNEITYITTPSSSGFSAAVLNAGEMQNKGFEALIAATIIKNGKFKWISSLNGSYNDNKILSLADGFNFQSVAMSRTGAGSVANVKGYAAFQVMAFDNKYDENGNIVLLADKRSPERGELTAYGSAFNKWFAGWNNEFSYDRFNLSFLIDGKWGGKLFSATDYYGYVFGLHKGTLDKREEYGANAPTYYTNVANNTSKIFVHSADFIKLRQIILGYTFPSSLFNNKIKSINVSAVGRNLFVFMKKTDNVDPESSYNATFPGLELGGVPAVRTYGINLSAKF